MSQTTRHFLSLRGVTTAFRTTAITLAACSLLSGCDLLGVEGDEGVVEALAPVVKLVAAPDEEVGRLLVRVAGFDGFAAAGVPVEWTVLSGRGTVAIEAGVTDADGIAHATWVLGPDIGEQQIQVWAEGYRPAVFTALAMASFGRAGLAPSRLELSGAGASTTIRAFAWDEQGDSVSISSHSWTSSDSTVAIVEKGGLLKATGAGTALVTVATAAGLLAGHVTVGDHSDPVAAAPEESLIWSRDLRTVTLDEIQSGRANGWDVEVAEIHRMAIDADGLRYDFPKRDCGNYSIRTTPYFGGDFAGVFIRARVKFDPFPIWDTVNPDCDGRGFNPDHKLLHLRVHNLDGGTDGAQRFGLKAGVEIDRWLKASTPGVDPNTEYQRLFSDLKAPEVLWDGGWHEIAMWGKVSSALGVADGEMGFWLDGNLIEFRGDYVINRKGIYGADLGSTLNMGPHANMAMWWQVVEAFGSVPSGYPMP